VLNVGQTRCVRAAAALGTHCVWPRPSWPCWLLPHAYTAPLATQTAAVIDGTRDRREFASSRTRAHEAVQVTAGELHNVHGVLGERDGRGLGYDHLLWLAQLA
jgi:hypothetical protein